MSRLRLTATVGLASMSLVSPKPAGAQDAAKWGRWEPPAASIDAWETSKTWQPRPLALPSTGHEPAPVPAAPPPPAMPPIVIQLPPAPVATPLPSEPEPTITRPRELVAQPAPPAPPKRAAPPRDAIATEARKSQLAGSAVDQLRMAHWSMRRGAFASARQAAWETLRTVASLRDAQTHDNRHSQWLEEAKVAIDESADFTGRFGRVDSTAMDRLIQVHETDVLRNVNTIAMTPPHAVEAYLRRSQSRLVAAVGGGPLAAEATVILADIEASESAPKADRDATPRQASLHAAELSLMFRRAAIEIDPENPQAMAKLGRTLLSRSMPAAAKPYLAAAVAKSPTRQNVEALHHVATVMGDLSLAQSCETRLQASSLPSELPLTVLSPAQFAATHRTMTTGQTRVSKATADTRIIEPATRADATIAARQTHASAPIRRPQMPAAAPSNLIPNSRLVDPQPSTTPRSRGWFW